MPDARKATIADIDALAATLADAFDGDPLMSFLVPARARYAAFFRLALRQNLAHDETWTVEGLAGAALWAPPGKWRLGLREVLKSLPTSVRILGRGLPRALQVLRTIEAAHPPGDHYYLGALGTAKSAQGKGVGSAVLGPVLERCDREGVGAYLESSKADNVPFYNRHGFEVTRQITLPGGGPPIWLMWREPK